MLVASVKEPHAAGARDLASNGQPKSTNFIQVFLCVDRWVGINNRALEQVVGTDRKPIVRADLFKFVYNM